MEKFNQTLFLLINADSTANPWPIQVAQFLAEYLILLVPVTLLLAWFRSSETTRRSLLEAAAVGLLGLLIAQAIGILWPHPRPFMMGLGTHALAHAADPSFPSDHLTLMWGVGFGLLRASSLRPLGLALSLLGLPMAWARIYLGVHFPLDMVGALLVAASSAWVCAVANWWYMPLVYPGAVRIYRFAFSPLIKFGWVLN